MREKGFFLPLKSSRYLLIYSVMMHFLAAVSVSLMAVEFVFKIFFVLALILSLLVQLYRSGLIGRYSKRPITLMNSDKEFWQISYADESLSATLSLESSWVTRLAVILNFKTDTNQRLSVMVLKDAVDKQQYRQLRVRIRLAFFQR
ncbi:protein YgfX [Methylophaga muralis]|uniref:Toxin CptA n=1 Tax=Methylophaga muralis TaxID=291169 RepID=A0A1E3GR33_9GAMM|nr:protein YgfX [Methylophaga muralis]ODN66509.1 hypothetical protein A9E74_01779 [Methylophaga muralis]